MTLRAMNPRPQLYARRSFKRDFQGDARCAHVQDTLVARVWDDPKRSLSEIVSFAAQALARMDQEFSTFPEGFNPWVHLIFEDDRRLVQDWQDNKPADARVTGAMLQLLDQLLQDATVDEAAAGAILALKEILHEARIRKGLQL
jgi:hypothetical protein